MTEPESRALVVNGTITVTKAEGPDDIHQVRTSGQLDPDEPTIDLTIPNLQPTDNVSDVEVVKMKRRKYPVRINNVEISAVDNGFMVSVPDAGMMTYFGHTMGAHRVFEDKASMLAFVGSIIGQVSYRYEEQPE